MPRNPDRKAVEAGLTDEEYELFSAEAKKRYWSNKRLNEILIRAFIRSTDKDEIVKLGIDSLSNDEKNP